MRRNNQKPQTMILKKTVPRKDGTKFLKAL